MEFGFHRRHSSKNELRIAACSCFDGNKVCLCCKLGDKSEEELLSTDTQSVTFSKAHYGTTAATTVCSDRSQAGQNPTVGSSSLDSVNASQQNSAWKRGRLRPLKEDKVCENCGSISF
ncbi:hypothetical protein CAPTEDRAFT_196565 [Capitella teleta]|uniref:Uncharacterized protein n=1 Tax=Capitella teleta TaxID=283909 RepID=R7TX44_CAPTE|nr:hypothetical protein CAPTEDRAFT_196565 [Capitella teleta]|eukprot:ELT95545.1 hypothetical protein CAPTEDRAFT_196565 [Capitella teleta]